MILLGWSRKKARTSFWLCVSGLVITRTSCTVGKSSATELHSRSKSDSLLRSVLGIL